MDVNRFRLNRLQIHRNQSLHHLHLQKHSSFLSLHRVLTFEGAFLLPPSSLLYFFFPLNWIPLPLLSLKIKLKMLGLLLAGYFYLILVYFLTFLDSAEKFDAFSLVNFLILVGRLHPSELFQHQWVASLPQFLSFLHI